MVTVLMPVVAVGMVVHPRHDDGPAGAATRRRGIGIRKKGPVRCQRIHMRRLCLRISIAPEIGPQIISNVENHIPLRRVQCRDEG